tara:strand:- start:1669 stop:2430 length:762 start_codon:yes stop_codon:yes gene_type:complete
MNKLFPIVLALMFSILISDDIWYLEDGKHKAIKNVIILHQDSNYIKYRTWEGERYIETEKVTSIMDKNGDEIFLFYKPLSSKSAQFSIGYNFDHKLSIEESSDEEISGCLTLGLWNMHLGEPEAILSYVATGFEFVLPFGDDYDIIKASIISYNVNIGVSIKKTDLFLRVGLSSLSSFELLGERQDVDLNPFNFKSDEWDGGWNYGLGLLYDKHILFSFTTHALTFSEGEIVFGGDYTRLDLQTSSINFSYLF